MRNYMTTVHYMITLDQDMNKLPLISVTNIVVETYNKVDLSTSLKRTRLHNCNCDETALEFALRQLLCQVSFLN